jgi:drug/metabolite transporter (DMT)-like permease
MNSTMQAPQPVLPAPSVTAWGQVLTAAQQPLVLGLIAVLMFAMTIPMTRLATVHDGVAQLPPVFIAASRSVLAALVSALYLWGTGAPRPGRAQWPLLGAIVLGGVLAFPLGMGWAVRCLPAWVVALGTACLPMFTALLATVWMGQRAPLRFWVACVSGVTLVGAFGAWQRHGLTAGALLDAAAWLGAVAALLVGLWGASTAYIAGARAARVMPAAQVMSWAQVLALPLTLPLTLVTAWQWQGAVVPQSAQVAQVAQVHASAWWALVYVGVVSSWLGFLAWYAALARDALRVSQVQLLQPLVGMGLAGLLLGEDVSPWAVPVGLAVALCMWLGQRSLRR